MGYLEWLLVILLPVIAFSIFASVRVKTTFTKYSKVRAQSGWVANEMAQMLMEKYNCERLTVQKISGSLTDNFNPSALTLNLSEPVYDSDSISALGVTAHEMGHAMQHTEGYFLLRLRSLMVPVVNYGSWIALPLVLVGLIIGLFAQMQQISDFVLFLGIIAYSLTTIFALCTLPVELNASRRARQMLLETGVVTKEESKQVKAVLNAAALTYVASLAVSLAYLIRFIIMISSIKRK